MYKSKINEKFKEYSKYLKLHTTDKAGLKDLKKQLKEEKKKEEAESSKKKLFVVDFKGDIKASQVENLREEISATLLPFAIFPINSFVSSFRSQK